MATLFRRGLFGHEREIHMNEDLEMKDWIKTRIANYLQNSDNTHQEIAKAAGIDRKIIPRIMSGADVTLENGIPLIKFFCPRDTVHATLKKFVPEMADSIKDQLTDPDYLIAATALNEAIKDDPLCNEIHFYAAINGGTTRDHVNFLAGYKGRVVLDYLFERGLIFETDGKIKAKQPNTVCTDIETILIKQKSNIQNFDGESLRDHQVGCASQEKGTTSLQGLKAIRQLHLHFVELFAKLRKQPWFEGEIPFFSQTLCGPINKIESAKIDKEEYKSIEITLENIRG